MQVYTVGSKSDDITVTVWDRYVRGLQLSSWRDHKSFAGGIDSQQAVALGVRPKGLPQIVCGRARRIKSTRFGTFGCHPGG